MSGDRVRRDRSSTGVVLIDALYVLLGAALAVVVAWPIYQDAQVWVVGGAGIAVGLLTAIGGRLLRLPWWADLLAAIALYFLVVVPVAIPSAFPGRWFDGLRDAAFGVVGGWKDIVTLAPPLGTYQAVLVPLLVVILFGTYAAARTAAIAGRAHIVASIVLVGMLAFGIVFGFGAEATSRPYAPGWLPVLPWVGVVTVAQVMIVAAALLVVLSLVWLAVRARRVRAEALARASGVAQAGLAVQRGSRWAMARRGTVATGMVVVALVVAGLVAVPAATADRDVVRDHVAPIEFVTRQASPLAGYRDWMSDARFDAELFTVEAPAGVDRLRLAVLDRYDGSQFTVSSLGEGSRFVRTATRLTTGGLPVTVTIEDGYTGPWVPLPGDVSAAAAFPVDDDRAVELEDALYYATDDSLAVVLAERADGSVGMSAGDVVVATGTPQPDARARIAAAQGSGSPINDVTKDRYPSLVAWVDAQGAGASGAGLITLIDRLRERGYLSHAYTAEQAEASQWERALLARDGAYEFEPSRAGHSAQRIEVLFDQMNERERQSGGPGAGASSADLVAAVGDDEQFAAAAALLAWSQGFDARVVLGVRLQDPAAADPTAIESAVPACTATSGAYTCRGQHMSAWIEVNVGGAWLPLDTSPQFAMPPKQNNEGENPPAHGTLPDRPASNVVDPPDVVKNEVQSTQAVVQETPSGLSLGAIEALRIAAVAAAAAGLLLVPPGIIVGAKSIRRSRRRTSEPEAAIVGAWEELVDGSVDLRLLPRAAGGTRSQIAERLDDPVARQLAAVADRAVFGGTAPTETDSALAWRMLGEQRRTAQRRVRLRSRIRGMLSLASFVRHLRPTSARLTLEPDPAEEATPNDHR